MAFKLKIWKGLLLSCGLILLGAALLAVGWRAEGYLSGLMLNLGTALLLFAPLLYLQRVLERRVVQAQEDTKSSMTALSSEVAEVRRQVQETSARLDQLGDVTRDVIRQQQDEDQAMFRQFEEEPSWESLSRLLVRARDLNSIDSRGIRVQIPGTWQHLRFSIGSRYSDDDTPHESRNGSLLLWVTVERLHGEPLEVVDWLPHESATEFMGKIITCLQRLGLFHESTFDATEILSRLYETLRIAITARTGVGPYSNLDRIIEIPNDQWVIQTTGLYSPEASYFLPGDVVIEGSDRPGGRPIQVHMKEKVWVDPDKFDMAYDIARGLYLKEKEMDKPPF
jgi:hypothetical protein